MFRRDFEEVRKLTDRSLGIDLSRTKWIAVPFDVVLRANAPDRALAYPEARAEFLRALDSATEVIGRDVCRSFEQVVSQREALDPKFFGKRYLELSVLSLRTADEHFLSQRFGSDGHIVGRSEFLNDVVAAVTISDGGFPRFQISALASLRAEITIAFLTLDSIEFREGSLVSWQQFSLTIAAGVLTALVGDSAAPILSEKITSFWKTHIAEDQVRHDIEKNANVTFKSLKFPFESVADGGACVLNFHESGISGPERARRIALVQSLLGAHFNTDLAVDGVLGPDTQHHLALFAKESGLPPDIRDKILRAKLAAVAHPYR